MGQNGSTNCCGTTADCQQTEVEVSEYQLNQNQSLKRPAQIQSQNGVALSEQQQKQLEEQHKILIQQQQQIQQDQHLGSTQQFQTGNDKSSTKKKKNMQNQELANHLRKISNNDRIIMENSIIHSTTKRLNEVTSTKKIKKELSEIVHFAKVLQLKIISSSTLSKGSLLYINAQGLENSLRKELDGMTFFGCKKRCRNIDNINQGQFDNFSSYSSSSSNEDEMEEDDHTFDQAASNQILDDIYDDQDNNQQNNIQNKQQFLQQKNQSSFPKSNLQSQQQQKSGLNSKNNLKQSSSVSAQQKFNNLRGSLKQKNQKDVDISFEEEEEKENNPLQMNKNGQQKQNGSLAKKQNQINNNNVNKTTGDGFKKNLITKQQQSNQMKKEELKDSKYINKSVNPQSNKINLNIKTENFKNNKNQFILEEKKNKVNKNGEIVNDFVIPSPDPEISKRHRGRHFQIYYDRTSNSYKIKDLGIGFGCFYKLDGPLLLKDNHLLNIGLIFVVINFTLNQDNTVLDASTINKSSNTTQQQHPSNNSQLKNNQSFLISQNISNNNKNTQNNLINNSLQLEGSEQNNQNIQFIQEQQIAKNSFRSIQQTSNNEEIVAIDDYQIYSSRNSEEGSKSQRIHETSQQDLNKNISKIMNIYYFKNQSDVIDNQRSNHEQEVVQNPQINQGSESSKLLKNNSLNDSRIKAQKEYSTITEEAKNQVSLSQKSSPQSQAQQIKGTLNQNTSKNSQVQKSRKSLSSVYQSKSKINQIADDKLGLISSSAHKNNNKTNLQSQKSDSKTNSHHQKSQKSIQHHQSNEKIVNSQKLLKQNSRSSSTQIINGASQSQKHFQLYDNDSDNKKPSQKTQQLSDNQKLKQNQSNSQKNSTQKMQTQQQNNSSQRQITFPESPISVTNQIDSSCGFGSEITYTEDQINELSNRVLMMKGNNPIPLIVNHNQICYDLSQQTSKNKPSSFSENIQNKDQQNHLVNEKNFKKKEQTKASPYNLQQKIDYQNYIEDVVFSNKIEQKLLLEKNNTEENKQQKNSAQYDEDDDCEANPDFINLYKTPAKPNSCSLKEAQYTNQIQNLKDKSYSAGQVLDLRKNSSQNEQQQQEQNNQEKQINTEASKNSNNKNVIQNKMQDQENKDKIQIEGKSLSDKIQQVDDKQKIENLREFDNNNGDESPFIVEMKKQHQKIIEEFSIKPIFALDSKEDLNKFSKESSQNSSDAKYSHVSKSDIKKHKRDIESVQSINELLNFMGGIQQSSNTDFIVPGSSVSKQNLSQIFDENSNLPSNVCSLQIIQEQQMTEQVKNSQKQQIQNKQIKDLKVNQKGTNQTNQLNSKHMSHIQTKLTAQQKNFIAVQQKQQKKSQTTYKRQDSPNQVVIQLKGSNSQTQGIKIQDLYIGQYSSKSLHQQKELKGEATQNSQQFLQKQRTQERKSSLIKPDNPQINQNKNQNVINLQKLNQHTQQLEKIIQSAGNNIITLAQDSKFSNSSSKEALRQSNNSQKMAKKFDSKSINNLTKNNSLTLTQDTSNVNSNNMNSVYSTQQTFLKKSTSNTQKQNNQNNYINLTNKSSDGGHIVMYQINSKKQ